EEGGVGGVQQDVREVIAECVHPPERVVEAEREPRHRDPVAHDGAREGPADLSPAEAAIGRVAEEIAVVVPEDEAVLERGREDREGNGRDREGRDPAGQRIERRGARLSVDRLSTIWRPAPATKRTVSASAGRGRRPPRCSFERAGPP